MNKLELIGTLALNYIKGEDAHETYRQNLIKLYLPLMNNEITEKEFTEICKADRELCVAFRELDRIRKHRVY